jgi:hypothetical protein
MGTESLPRLLDRDLQKVRAEPAIKKAGPLLREIVNYGTNAFARCEASTHDTGVTPLPGEGHLVILLLYRHVIEMIDAMEVLFAQSVVVPALTQLRSAFEAYLQLEWIVKDNTLRRVHAYLVCDIRNRLKIYRSLDPSSNLGKQLKAKIAKDKSAGSVSPTEVADLEARIQNLEDLLTQKNFAEVNAEYMKHPQWHWYRLFDGPATLEQLADRLELPYWYEVLYREASDITHAGFLARNLRRSGIQILREPVDLIAEAEMAVHLGVCASECILNFYRPGEITGFWQWHQREIADQGGLNH